MVYSTGQLQNLDSAYSHPQFDRTLDKNRNSITRNILCIPLKIEKRCIGCLEIANKINGKFTHEDCELAILISRELASGLMMQYVKPTIHKNNYEFNEHITTIANENLLTPLLKNLMIILTDLLKSGMYNYFINIEFEYTLNYNGPIQSFYQS